MDSLDADCLDQVFDEAAVSACRATLLADCHAEDDSVRRALDKLSRKLRVVVILRHYWDLSYAEISEIMDLPLGTVKSRLNLAMRLMRDDLESDFPCPARSMTEA
jgi:RNA polymerase sigma factor (sigma-70 family)